jgi:alpha-L-rhamnosidase
MLELNRDGQTGKAYELLMDQRFPSWLYAVTNGIPGVFQETTTSERWNSYVSGAGPGHGYSGQGGGNSFNHYAFGSVGELVWRTVAGINADDSNPAYKNVVITPQIGAGLTYASGFFHSIHGLISSSWTTNNTTNSYAITVPANATATLYIPSTNLARITESGLPATNAPGVLVLPITNGASAFQLGSGSYNFTNWP